MTIKVAVLGAGYFAQFHHDGWRRLDGVEIAGIADQDVKRAQATGCAAFSSLSEMLEATSPDILDIVVPPGAHVEAIETALKAAVPTIICQKPFCGNLQAAKAATSAAAAVGSRLIVHENFRFQPWFRCIKDSIHDGMIGEPLQGTWRLRPGDGQGPDAYLSRQAYFQKMPRFLVHETGVHYVDVFRYLFGAPSAVYADLRRVNPVIAGEDAGIVTFDHPEGVQSILDANRCLDHAAENSRCTMGEGIFEGTEGTLTVRGDGSVHLRKFGGLDTIEVLAPNNAKAFGGDCTFHLQAHVLGSLFGKVPLENSADDYLYVMEIAEAIYQSAEEGRKVELNAKDKWSGPGI